MKDVKMAEETTTGRGHFPALFLFLPFDKETFS